MADLLVSGILSGDMRAVARAITRLENGEPEVDTLLTELFPHAGKALTIGITGAPGAGKSSLVDRLALHYRELGHRVGILAVDPSSPFTGGALLGDRIRMQDLASDEQVFIRSMATRGRMGGLSRGTADAATVLDAAGFDRILIETVGVGQDEVDIIKAADLSIVVLVPGMGDDIQAIKAGIMEIGDIFVINKAEREGVERTERELIALLEMAHRDDGWDPPIVRTVATRQLGIEPLARAIDQYAAHLRAAATTGRRPARRVEMARQRLLELLSERLLRQFVGHWPGPESLDQLAESLARREEAPWSAVERLLATRSTRSGPAVGHLGIAVPSIEVALQFWRDALGLDLKEVETVPDQGVRVAMLPVGTSRVELLEALQPDSPVGRFLERRGAGIHHLCLEVSDLPASLARLREAGVRLIDEEPRPGAGGALVAFVHPASTGGVLLELTQKGSH
ncbi:MAG: methylmalonyl Co-A mutase-associated GTPase MeaB [Acidobacteriota bacterium]